MGNGKPGKAKGGAPELAKKKSAFAGNFDDRVEAMVNQIKEQKGETRKNMCVR